MYNEAIDHMHCGTEVYWQEREASGQDGRGYIFGTIWGTEDYGILWGIKQNGVVVEFDYRGKSRVWFYVSHAALEVSWRGDCFCPANKDFMFLEIQDYKGTRLVKKNVDFLAYCISNRQIVPVWTNYFYTESKL